MKRPVLSLALLTLLGFVGMLGAVSGSSAAPSPAWGTAIEAPGTLALSGGAGAVLESVSCATAGNCAAGGAYAEFGAPFNVQALVVDETNGSWGNAVEVAGMASLNSGGNADVSAISCATAGNCAAGGFYADGSGKQQSFVVDETNGNWGTAIEVPGTATLNSGSGGGNGVDSISCPTVGNCTAAGEYRDGFGHQQAFVVDETSGSWGTAIEIPGMATLNSGNAEVRSVSCATAGNCAAGGDYTDGSGYSHAFVVDETNGSWGTAIEVPGTAFGSTAAVSCAAASDCAAGGSYTDSSGYSQAFVVEETNGSWGDAIEVTLNGGGGGAGVHSISCATVGNCAAGGIYQDALDDYRAKPFVVDETNGTWGAPSEVPGAETLNQGWSNNGVNSVSCGTAGNCSAVGNYRDGAGNIQSFVADETNGSWDNAIEIPGTATLSGGGEIEVESVSCATAGNCAAVGQYTDGSGYIHAFVVDSTAPKTDQTISISTHAPSSAPYGSGFTVAATGGGSGNPVAYGSSGGCTNNGADFKMTSSSTDCTVTYDQAGDDNYNAATQVTETVTAEKGDQTITFMSQPDRTYGDADFDPGATASSRYSISYGASGACSILSGQVHLTGAGSCTVTADQPGDANYNAAPQVQRTFSVGKAALSITASPRQKFFAETVTLGTTAFTTSGLVGSDSVSGVTLTSSGAAAAAPSGTYPITVSNAVAGPSTNLAGNYTITYHIGPLTVTPVGIIGLSGVTVATKGGKIDSFNSSAGPYGPSNHGSAALVVSNGALSLAGVSLLGSAGSARGSVSVARTARVSGSVVAGTTATILGKVGGSVMQHSPGPPFSAAAVPACSPFSGKSGISGGTFTYSSGNLTVKSGTVKLASRTYCFNNVTLDSGSTLSVGGPVTIDLKGTLTGNGRFVNRTRLPRNLQLDHYTATGSMRIVGNSDAYMTILAPQTRVTIAGGSFFGTVLAGTVNLTGGLAFHADQH